MSTDHRRGVALISIVGSLTAIVPETALAHLELEEPTSRYGGNVLKNGPCGRTGGQRSQNVTTFQSGETIVVTWNEYIDHPGHYRISFDVDGDDDFVDPPCLANCDTRNPTVEFYSNDAVLMDDIPDNVGGSYQVTVTLPDVECGNCTLQVIQVMYDKPPYTLPGNEMYYQCADLVLVRPNEADGGVVLEDAGTNDGGDAGAAVPADAGATEPIDGGDVKDSEPGCACRVEHDRGRSTSGLMIVLLLLGGRRLRGAADSR